jgi:hypothetical protein
MVQLFENIEGDSLEKLSLQEYNTNPFNGGDGYILSGIFLKIDQKVMITLFTKLQNHLAWVGISG